MDYLMLLIGTVLVNNIVLVKFLGLCSFMGVSQKIDSAIGLSFATTFVLTVAAAAAWIIEFGLLKPLEIEYLRIISFILVIAATVQFTEMVIRKISPTLYQVLGIFLPLITTNCAVLGVALLNIQENYSFIQSLLAGFWDGIRFYCGDGDVCGDARAVKSFASARALFWNANRVYHSGIVSVGIYGFCGFINSLILLKNNLLNSII